MIAALTQWIVAKSGAASYLLIGLTAALGLVLVAAGARELVNRATLAEARGALATAQGERDTLRQQLATATSAATSAQSVIDLLRLENERLVEQATRVRESAEAAVAKARAAEADASRTLDAWMDRYASATRAGTDCAGALVAMEAACAAIGDY